MDQDKYKNGKKAKELHDLPLALAWGEAVAPALMIQ